MKKLFYALIAIPLFIIWPFSLLICTECCYSDNIPSFIAFIIGSLIYYVIVITPLNYIFWNKRNKNSSK